MWQNEIDYLYQVISFARVLMTTLRIHKLWLKLRKGQNHEQTVTLKINREKQRITKSSNIQGMLLDSDKASLLI